VSFKFLSAVITLCFPLVLTTPARAAEPRFVDATTYFSTESGRQLLPSGFAAVEGQLADQFAATCADAFCEGVVSNWTPLALRCSVDQLDHVVGECAWTFAGSTEDVDAVTGQVAVSSDVRTCGLGLQGSAAELAEFLAVAAEAKGHAFGLLMVQVPGRTDGLTLFDVLGSCLD
jgi:hypothetical protein